MIKKIAFLLMLSLIILALAGCVTASSPGTSTGVPTNIPTTQAASPSSTPVQPTETPTAVPPTATATTPPQNVIQHFPTGQAFTVTAIHMSDANTGWAIGGLENVGEHVLFTTDSGSTWKDITPPEEEALSGERKTATGFFQDARTAWVTYAINGGNPVPTQPVVWRTQDSGATWQDSQPLDITGLSEIYFPSDLQFINGQDGWLLVHVGVGMSHDYVVLFNSKDGGVSWTKLIDPYGLSGIQGCSKTGMLFTDAMHGWLTGDCNGVMAGVRLFNTSDGGANWQPVTLPAPANAPNLFTDGNYSCGSYDPFFFSNDLGHMGVRCNNYTVTPNTNNYYVYTTQDGGSTWTSSTYPGESLYFFSANTGWALSKKIQRTTDGGVTWTAISNVTWTAQVDFISEQIGWVVARSGDQVALVKTDNGGARWSELTPTINP